METQKASKGLFLLSKELCVMDKYANSFANEMEIDVDDPESRYYIECGFEWLEKKSNLISIDEDTALVTGLTYEEAVQEFGKTLFTEQQTKSLLAEMIHNNKKMDYYEAVDFMNWNPDTNTIIDMLAS